MQPSVGVKTLPRKGYDPVSKENLMKNPPSQNSPDPESILAKNSKTARKNEIVPCPKSGVKLPRKKLKKHKQTAHETPSMKMEKRRIESLKNDLKFLKNKRKKLPAGTIDLELIESIAAVQNAISIGPAPKWSWSPILPGSFGNGRRR